MMARKKEKKEKMKRLRPNDLLSSLIDFDKNTTDGISTVKISGKKITFTLLRISGIDIFHFLQDDAENAYDSFASATMALSSPHKYVFSDCSPLLNSQKIFFCISLKKLRMNTASC